MGSVVSLSFEEFPISATVPPSKAATPSHNDIEHLYHFLSPLDRMVTAEATPLLTSDPAKESTGAIESADLADSKQTDPPASQRRIIRGGGLTGAAIERIVIPGSSKTANDLYSINHPPVDSIQDENTPIHVVYDKEGQIDCMKTRISFTRKDWYDQFLILRGLLPKQPSPENATYSKLWESSNGYTQGMFTKSYAVLTNACISPPDPTIVIHEDSEGALQRLSKTKLSKEDFYFNVIRSEAKYVPYSKLHPFGNHTAIIHPRNFNNIYHYLEGSSLLIHLALHPHAFPPISHVIASGQRALSKATWHGFMEFLYLDLFPPESRPQLHLLQNDDVLKRGTPFCDQFVIVLRNWDTKGAGDFIPEYLGVDMIRASAYHHASVVIREKSKERLCALQIRRVNKRRVLNEVALFEDMMTQFRNEILLEHRILEKEDAIEQVRLFASLDLLIAAHGAGLTNVIFMLPHSFLIELMPPYWYLACYKRLSENADLGYRMIRAVGKKGRQCDKSPSSLACQQQGIRDRDFNISSSLLMVEIRNAIRYVRAKKYA